MNGERAPGGFDGDLHRAARELVAGYEEERRRVARVLHDRVGQALGAVVLNLELSGDAPLAQDLRAELVAELRGAIADLRDLSLAQRPALLDEGGLAEALRLLVRRLGEAGGRPVAIEAAPGSGRATPALEIVAYRLAQASLEALDGDGDAPLVLTLARDGDELLLQFDGEGAGDAASMPALAARARLLGGRGERRSADSFAIRLPAA